VQLKNYLIMKKILLTLTAFAFTLGLNAQIIFNVLGPQQFEGNYEMTHASDWALTPDLADPANAVTGFLAFGSDGSAADSLGCLQLTNVADVTGKIAVIYRGECEFGTKALNGNLAGAIAVVIINNVPGSPVGMAAGTNGDQVNVPVVMISQEAGALLRDEIIAGNVEVFIGNKLGLFSHDLGFFAEDVYLPNGNSMPALISENGNEFNYTPAAWIHNYGQMDTDAANFDVTITHNGNTVYSHNVNGISLASGQNLYVSTPNFAPTDWSPGLYTITLEASLDENLAVQNYVTAIDALMMIGTGYTSANESSTSTSGSGSGLTVDITAAPTNTVQSLNGATLNNGTGYDDGNNVPTTTNNAGVGLLVNTVTVVGQVIQVSVSQPGSGYAVGDIINILGGDGNASIEVESVNLGGEIISIAVNNPGSGYAVGDIITVSGGNNDATFNVVAVASEVEEYDGDNVYTINFVVSDEQIFTRSSVNPDGTMIAGPGYRTNDGSAFSACVAFTHPNAGRMALEGMYFGATGSVDVPIEGELLGLTVWKMNATFNDINDPNYAVDVTLVANADFDIPAGAENGDIFFSEVKTGDGDFLIMEDNSRYVFCVGTDNPDVFILFDGGGLDNRRQYEGINGNAQPDYYIYTTGLGRFTDFYGLPSIGVKFFDKNLVSTEENNLVEVTPFPKKQN